MENIFLDKTGLTQYDTKIKQYIENQGFIKQESDPVASAQISQHEADTSNPHSVTAEQVGTYTKSEIDNKISSISSSSNDVNTQYIISSNTENLFKMSDVSSTKKRAKIIWQQSQSIDPVNCGMSCNYAYLTATDENNQILNNLSGYKIYSDIVSRDEFALYVVNASNGSQLTFNNGVATNPTNNLILQGSIKDTTPTSWDSINLGDNIFCWFLDIEIDTTNQTILIKARQSGATLF